MLARANQIPFPGSIAIAIAIAGQSEAEGGTLPFLALEPDLAAMGLHDVLHDRQPEAGPPSVAGTGPVHPVETFKHPVPAGFFSASASACFVSIST